MVALAENSKLKSPAAKYPKQSYQIVTLNFQHLDVLNPKYQFVSFGSLPRYAIFYYDGHFRIKMDFRNGMEIFVETYLAMDQESFVFCARPVEIHDPDVWD